MIYNQTIRRKWILFEFQHKKKWIWFSISTSNAMRLTSRLKVFVRIALLAVLARKLTDAKLVANGLCICQPNFSPFNRSPQCMWSVNEINDLCFRTRPPGAPRLTNSIRNICSFVCFRNNCFFVWLKFFFAIYQFYSNSIDCETHEKVCCV